MKWVFKQQDLQMFDFTINIYAWFHDFHALEIVGRDSVQ